MGHEFYAAGFDENGRAVRLAFAQTLLELVPHQPPSTPFIFFIVADTTSASAEEIAAVAEDALNAGAVYVLAWGPGCDRVEDIFDGIIVQRDPDGTAPVIITTSHSHQPLEDALDFAVSVAVPDEAYRCHDVIMAFGGNVNWYNNAHEFLEEALTSDAV